MGRYITTLLIIITTSLSAQTGMDSIFIKEINNFRSNPKSYVPAIKNYIRLQNNCLKRVKSGNMKVTSTNGTMTKKNGMKNRNTVSGTALIRRNIRAANEMLRILKTIKPMDTLIYSETMDNITDTHGKYLDSTNQAGHYDQNGKGIDGRFSLKNYSTVRENICNSGFAIKRKKDFKPAIIMLLIDSGIRGRGHRKNLLATDITHISVYVSENICIQNFATPK